jgi:hypothetical protein
MACSGTALPYHILAKEPVLLPVPGAIEIAKSCTNSLINFVMSVSLSVRIQQFENGSADFLCI